MIWNNFRYGAIAALLLAPCAANAADLPSYKAPAYVAPLYANWTGFYVGLNGGYGWGKADVSNVFGDFTTDSTNGWLIGATLGYNYQTGMWVWGIEGDLDWSLIKGNSSNVLACGGGTCEVKDTWFGTLRGRVGYAGWNNFMPYLTGGGAFAGLKVSPDTGGTFSHTAMGWTVGAGVEYAAWSNWSMKLEYLYADLGKSTCGADVCGVDTEIEPKVNIVRVGFNYRF